MKKVAAFLDFQGTLGGGGLEDIKTFAFYPFSIPAIKKLNDNGILAIGITNQSHISKGELTWEEYETKLQQLKDELAKHDAYFDAVYCCPHVDSDNCLCKKPKTGMIDAALNDFEIDLQSSFVVGDMGMTDMLLAKQINSKAILVLTGVGIGSLNEFRYTWKETEPDFVAQNMLEAVDYILTFSNKT